MSSRIVMPGERLRLRVAMLEYVDLDRTRYTLGSERRYPRLGWLEDGRILLLPYTSSLRNLPGPPASNWLFGSINDLRASENFMLHDAWLEKYGPTLKFNIWFKIPRLLTIDTRAINYILSHSQDYPKPERTRHDLTEILGNGLVVAEGELHHREVSHSINDVVSSADGQSHSAAQDYGKTHNPAFGPAQIRELTDIFVEKAQQLRDMWRKEVAEGTARIDVQGGLTKMTLDVIGLAGKSASSVRFRSPCFNYEFSALNPDGKPNELDTAFEVMFSYLSEFERSYWPLLRSMFPILRRIPDGYTRRTAAAQKVTRRIGMQLIAEKKEAVRKAAQSSDKGVESALQSRDLLTLLIKANMSSDVPEDQRLSDDDVLAQVPTFLVAGHETTSNATTWCLYALSHQPDVQHKLREELWGIRTDNPSMDELNALPYLDAVIRETMRLYPPVVGTFRIASKDDIIPLATPYTDSAGRVHDSVSIKKGTSFSIPIVLMNRSKALWGDDALVFRPERWESLSEAVQQIPGVWGNMMTFLGGPRACIGYRFSLVESVFRTYIELLAHLTRVFCRMKALIFTLVRSLEFEQAVPTQEIMKKIGLVQRPFVRSEMDKGTQMPLIVKPYVRD
ncbi:predicted protein [Postia placenta Mad-698-R]|nr:predicted protein [Postia placenta Mad-698-R]